MRHSGVIDQVMWERTEGGATGAQGYIARPAVRAYCPICARSQSLTVLCQSRLFCGFNTQ